MDGFRYSRMQGGFELATAGSVERAAVRVAWRISASPCGQGAWVGGVSASCRQ